MGDLKKLIDEVNSSMAMEGMPLTKTDKDRIRRCAGNDELVEEAIAELIKKHKAVKTDSCELETNK